MYKNSHCAGSTETRFARDELAVATCARWPSELELEEWARRQGLCLQASPRQLPPPLGLAWRSAFPVERLAQDWLRLGLTVTQEAWWGRSGDQLAPQQ